MERREFIGLGAGALAGAALLGGCAAGGETAPFDALPAMPPASPDPESPFGVDANVNMATIDEWLGRPDCAYFDMRMVKDPAHYEDIGGNAELAVTLEGFTIAPWPYIGTLQELPVEGAYAGQTWFDVEWTEDGEVASFEPNFAEAEAMLADLFPRDRNVVLICGGGGYAGMARKLLLAAGWDPARVYNAGGAWDYAGYRSVELVNYDRADAPTYYLWRARIAPLDDFSYYTPLAKG